MLVLSRKLEQEIHMTVAEEFVWKPGMVIKVVLLSFSGAVTRVGVEAPQEIVVRRGELADRPVVPFVPHSVAVEPAPVDQPPAPPKEQQTDG